MTQPTVTRIRQTTIAQQGSLSIRIDTNRFDAKIFYSVDDSKHQASPFTTQDANRDPLKAFSLVQEWLEERNTSKVGKFLSE